MHRFPLWLIRVFWAAVHSMSLGAIALMSAGLGARWTWWLDLTTHFRVQCLLALATATVLYLVGKRYREAIVTGLFSLGIGWTLLPFYMPTDETPPTALTRNVRVVSMNVWRYSTEYQRVLNYVRSVQPDLLLMIEVTPAWATAMEPLRAEFEETHFFLRSNSLGMAFFSKIPLESVTVEDPAWIPVVSARLRVDGRPLTIFGVHPPPTGNAKLAGVRRISLNDLATRVRQETNAVVVVGDMNTTSWSPGFDDFLSATGLRDTRLGRGIQPTWSPPQLPMLPAPLRIPIDHCLVSGTVFVHDRHLGENVGSDHLPIVIDLAIEQQ